MVTWWASSVRPLDRPAGHRGWTRSSASDLWVLALRTAPWFCARTAQCTSPPTANCTPRPGNTRRVQPTRHCNRSSKRWRPFAWGILRENKIKFLSLCIRGEYYQSDMTHDWYYVFDLFLFYFLFSRGALKSVFTIKNTRKIWIFAVYPLQICTSFFRRLAHNKIANILYSRCTFLCSIMYAIKCLSKNIDCYNIITPT